MVHDDMIWSPINQWRRLFVRFEMTYTYTHTHKSLSLAHFCFWYVSDNKDGRASQGFSSQGLSVGITCSRDLCVCVCGCHQARWQSRGKVRSWSWLSFLPCAWSSEVRVVVLKGLVSVFAIRYSLPEAARRITVQSPRRIEYPKRHSLFLGQDKLY